MKKRYFALLLIAPLLASCSGLPVSREDALNIINNIEANLKAVGGTSYISTSLTSSGEASTELTSIYSKESKFFHTYTISSAKSGRISESWKFVQPYERIIDGTSMVSDYIFDITRIVSESSLKNDLEKQYVVTYEPFSEETWNKYASDYEDRLNRRFLDVLSHSRTLIEDYSNKIDLRSLNGNSIFLDYKEEVEGITTQSTEYEINIKNNQLISLKTISDDQLKTETSYKYTVGDIMYPSFKVTIV